MTHFSITQKGGHLLNFFRKCPLSSSYLIEFISFQIVYSFILMYMTMSKCVLKYVLWRIHASQTTFPTSIMDNYKRFALSEKIQTKCYINFISSSLLIFNQNFIFSRNLFVTIYNPEISKSTINWSILGSLRR